MSEKENGIIYLASPHTHPDPCVRQERFESVCKVAAKMMLAGHIVFSPISHSHHLCDYGLPGNLDFWIKQDFPILEACSEFYVLMLNGWRESKGIAMETERARELSIPITYIDKNLKEYPEA